MNRLLWQKTHGINSPCETGGFYPNFQRKELKVGEVSNFVQDFTTKWLSQN